MVQMKPRAPSWILDLSISGPHFWKLSKISRKKIDYCCCFKWPPISMLVVYPMLFLSHVSNWLVGTGCHEFYFPIWLGNVIPSQFTKSYIFQRGILAHQPPCSPIHCLFWFKSPSSIMSKGSSPWTCNLWTLGMFRIPFSNISISKSS